MVTHTLAKHFSNDEPVLWMNDYLDNIVILAVNYVKHFEFSS